MSEPFLFDLLDDDRLRWAQSTCSSAFGHPSSDVASARVWSLEGQRVEICIENLQACIWSNEVTVMKSVRLCRKLFVMQQP